MLKASAGSLIIHLHPCRLQEKCHVFTINIQGSAILPFHRH